MKEESENEGFVPPALFNGETLSAVNEVVSNRTVEDVRRLNAQFEANIRQHCMEQQADLTVIQAQLQREHAVFLKTLRKIDSSLYSSGGSAFESTVESTLEYRDRLDANVKHLEAAITAIETQVQAYKRIQSNADHLDINKRIEEVKKTDKASKNALKLNGVDVLQISEKSVEIVKEKSKSFVERAKAFALSALTFAKKHKEIIIAGVLVGVGLWFAATGFGLVPGLMIAAKGALTLPAIASVVKSGATVICQNEYTKSTFNTVAEEGARNIRRVRGEEDERNVGDKGMESVGKQRKMSEIIAKPVEMTERAEKFEQASDRFKSVKKTS